MSTADMLEKEFQKLKLSESDIPEILQAITESIPANIPYRMKLALAVSEAITYASQFRISIAHWNESIIPVNAITFVIAKSGTSKDSSLRHVRACFDSSYDMINEERKQRAIRKAIAEAKKNGDDNPENFSTFKKYYRIPNPLFASISTGEGLIQHLNDLECSGLGAGFLYSGELSSELQSNPNITDMLKIVSELFDMGKKEVKLLKDRMNQSREIRSMPMTALFQSSQDMIIYDDSVKRKFRTEFTSKLARRSFFVFMNEEPEEKEYEDLSELLKHERRIEDESVSSRHYVSEYLEKLTGKLLKTLVKFLTVSSDVRDLFILYKKYNESVSKQITSQYPITRLTRQHMQWKALKLSGAIAILMGNSVIKPVHYRSAMEFVELISNDILLFEKELQKEPYELCVDYIRRYALDGQHRLNLHSMRKLGFISRSTNVDGQLSEIARLMNSYDDRGMYEAVKDGIQYKEIRKTDKILLSYVPVSGTKMERGKQCASGFICEEYEFEELENMLMGDFAYSMFRFANGIRGKDNIISGCKWIVLDIDDSEITDTDAHFLLCDLNHFVVRTSNPDNEHKFRVLIELDSEIDISDIQWPKFIQAVARDLGLKQDPLAKSQIFFSYADRTILKETQAKPLKTKPYLNEIADIKTPELPDAKEASRKLDNPMTTFEKAYNAQQGEGRRKLIWAARYARELGGDKEYIKKLLRSINDYWVMPLCEKDFGVILNQIDRWSI